MYDLKDEEDLLLFYEDDKSKQDKSKHIVTGNIDNIRHKFIEKIMKIVENKLLVDFYIEYFDNYKTSSPQVVLFITDLKKFLEKRDFSCYECCKLCNRNNMDSSIIGFCNGNMNMNSFNFSNIFNSNINITNITIGDVLNIGRFSNLQYASTFVMNKLMGVFECKSIWTCLDIYRQQNMFSKKELVCLCMRIDFSNKDVYSFGVDVVNL